MAATYLINGVAGRLQGGSTTFLKNLVGSLAKLTPNDRFIIFVSSEMKTRCAELVNNNGVILKTIKYADFSIFHRLYWEQIVLPRYFHKVGGNSILISPANICCIAWPGPQLLVVQSIAPFCREAQQRKGSWSPLRYFMLKHLSRLSFRTADAVVLNSRATQIIAMKQGCPQHKVYLIPMGQSELFQNYVRDTSPPKEKSNVYLLAVGTVTPHKNLEALIRALSELRSRGHSFPLKVVGSTKYHSYFDKLKRLAANVNVSDLVTFTGQIPYEQLPPIYAGATCYILPSLVENFPHTLIEAMSVGCPIVSSKQIPTAEICEGAALECDAFDSSDIAGQIERVITDDALRASLKASALNRVDRFDWRKLAEEYLSLLRNLET